ncbi:protein prenyltransferase alpha subunit repeat-containing protein 1-like isoform X2 [Stegodyphus dumicola]|uniref:protein prenyltransferase alpha subunit repeat-containing protein 1-like isoform X2 n=1 Tax=Stegodyphus dumicola TaxID=202533 RepID=UPI0015B13E77|nr:protein prenyltransferase alpha subunit repeat-containing protein 1-like isoform X2 [Stegodyphus dumicola]
MEADDLAERILLDLRNTFKKDPLIGFICLLVRIMRVLKWNVAMKDKESGLLKQSLACPKCRADIRSLGQLFFRTPGNPTRFRKRSDEFDILPVHESIRNTCPVIHIEHKVALEDWCIKHVYVYAYNKFFAWKKKPYKFESDKLLIWTCAILLINPEIETVWNARKWILLELIKNKPSTCTLQQIIEHEFLLCTRVANLYPNNYYAWCHRSWIIQEILHVCLKTVSDELARMEHWVSTHISDYSGFHYRQFLLSCFSSRKKLSNKHVSSCPLHITHLEGEGNMKCNSRYMNGSEIIHFSDTLEKELILLSSLQTSYPGHETLWYHRRYVLYEFQYIKNLGESCPVKLKNMDGVCIQDVVQCKRHKLECNFCNTSDWDLLKEENFLTHCIQRAKNNDWEKQLIERHLKWLRNVILWPVRLSVS